MALRTNGYMAPGDAGGALFLRVDSEPRHAGKMRSADGAWWELAVSETVTPKMFGQIGAGADAATLQTFFDYLKVAGPRSVLVAGSFTVNAPLLLDLKVSPVTCIRWNARFRAVAPIDGYLLTIRQAVGVIFEGRLELIGTGNHRYATRTCRSGLLMQGCAVSVWTGQTTLRNFKEHGLRFIGSISTGKGNASKADIGRVRALHCGSTGRGLRAAPTARFTARNDAGEPGSPAQRTTLTVSALPDATDMSGVLLVYRGRPYVVLSADAATSTLTLSSWLVDDETVGEVGYIYGCAVYVSGSDANVVKAQFVDAFVCGVGLRQQGFYTGISERPTTEACGVGLQLGNPPSALAAGHTVINPYFELNAFDIVSTSIARQNCVILNPTALDLAKCFGVRPRHGSGNFSSRFRELPGVAILRNGRLLSDNRAWSDGASGAASELSFEDNSLSRRVIYADTHRLTLVDDPGIRLAFGLCDLSAKIMGSGSGQQPQGAITVACEDGYTINSAGSEIMFAGLIGPIMIDARIVERNWLVVATPLGGLATPEPDRIQIIESDADFILSPLTSPRLTQHVGVLSADRTITLSTAGAFAGTEFRITRSGEGAFGLRIGERALTVLQHNSWCEVVFDGEDYVLSARGTL